jgi:hypothetical protein
MKKLSIIAIVFCFSNSVIAQTYQSKLKNGNCAEMSLRYDASGLYYHLDEITCAADQTVRIYNLTSISYNSDGFTIPDDGRNYWLIPFDGSGPYLLEKTKAYCVYCYCGDVDGSCSFYFTTWLCHGCSCETVFYECAGGLRFRSGGVIVQAGSIFEE